MYISYCFDIMLILSKYTSVGTVNLKESGVQDSVLTWTDIMLLDDYRKTYSKTVQAMARDCTDSAMALCLQDYSESLEQTQFDSEEERSDHLDQETLLGDKLGLFVHEGPAPQCIIET